MSEPTITEYDTKVLELVSKIHQRLNQKFPFIQESRELSPQQNQLMIELGQDPVRYKVLVSAMAIDTYTEHIGQIFNEADILLETLAVCLSCAQKMKNELANQANRKEVSIGFENLYNSILNMTESASLFNPASPYLQLYRSVISNDYEMLAENIYNNLREENNELKQRLRLNDEKVLDLEIKLTQLLQQHEGCDSPGGIQRTMKEYELRDQLYKKYQEIQKMDEEFCFQIQKYNIVYETLKRELDEYKSVQDNVNTVDLIEKLETEIVVLREEKEREQMINEQLRRRLQIVSEANLGPIDRYGLAARRRQNPLTRPSLVNRNQHYQQPSYHQSYYDTAHESYDTEQDSEDQHVKIPYRDRLSPQPRDYSQWTKNLITTSYRY